METKETTISKWAKIVNESKNIAKELNVTDKNDIKNFKTTDAKSSKRKKKDSNEVNNKMDNETESESDEKEKQINNDNFTLENEANMDQKILNYLKKNSKTVEKNQTILDYNQKRMDAMIKILSDKINNLTLSERIHPIPFKKEFKNETFLNGIPSASLTKQLESKPFDVKLFVLFLLKQSPTNFESYIAENCTNGNIKELFSFTKELLKSQKKSDGSIRFQLNDEIIIFEYLQRHKRQTLIHMISNAIIFGMQTGIINTPL